MGNSTIFYLEQAQSFEETSGPTPPHPRVKEPVLKLLPEQMSWRYSPSSSWRQISGRRQAQRHWSTGGSPQRTHRMLKERNVKWDNKRKLSYLCKNEILRKMNAAQPPKNLETSFWPKISSNEVSCNKLVS